MKYPPHLTNPNITPDYQGVLDDTLCTYCPHYDHEHIIAVENYLDSEHIPYNVRVERCTRSECNCSHEIQDEPEYNPED